MNKKYGSIFFIVWLLVIAHLTLQAQEGQSSFERPLIQLEIQAIVYNQPLVLGQMVFIPILSDSVQIDRLKFYLSDISISNTKVNQENSSERFFLIDLEKPASLKRQISLTSGQELDSIYFYIGVDSVTQMKGPQAGDLDPMNGMYWSWRSGYINFKCEGISPFCPGRNKKFMFHIGGFQSPFNALQRVALPLHSDSIVVQIDLTALFTASNVKENYQVMSPSEKAMTFANQLPSLFSIIP
jgi:hypothetical protein